MSAVISPCEKYRYLLRRGGNDPLPFVMLNPSTADANTDDPTIRRCMGFAKREGRNGIVVVNLYAFRTAYPAQMKSAAAEGFDIVGPLNDYNLSLVSHSYPAVVCAWGASHVDPERVKFVVDLMRKNCNVLCFGTTREGHPRHPLYLKGDAPLVEFNP
ncbi:DUF1643 containing protein [Stenotrophomonas phage vB_SmaS_DLP_5]|uniref:DUF1643 containing protein n=1 Tax=Stenotrophomonas phage vB_SmaS_DLP_5 TaxID=2044561 RepID=A0A2D2W2H2_9CAUD|nr:DUF1643 containing protein [Stenotrophomonas phage vB_SmaS_DLP_5]ATS92337.1 DUF1643 containing protein [Stenotrophomonas phage vB_SmaS_DLP_5]